MNLLTEVNSCLESIERTKYNVCHVKTDDIIFGWGCFELLANREFETWDEIVDDLVVVGTDFWLQKGPTGMYVTTDPTMVITNKKCVEQCPKLSNIFK